jgi:hypothetical protein
MASLRQGVSEWVYSIIVADGRSSRQADHPPWQVKMRGSWRGAFDVDKETPSLPKAIYPLQRTTDQAE